MSFKSYPGTWHTAQRNAHTALNTLDSQEEEPVLPVYEAVDGQGIILSPSENGPRFPRTASSDPIPSQSFLFMERLQDPVVYRYSMHVNGATTQIAVQVEAATDRPHHYIFSLSLTVGQVERALCKPVTTRLSVDPRQLDFSVFLFPPRACLPVGCLYNLRVWLRSSGTDHRIFGDNDVWIGRDPDFRSIADASFAILRNATQDMLIYQAVVGYARVSFIVRWHLVEDDVHTLSLDYEAGGVGRTLIDKCHLRLFCDPQTISFMIYTIPAPSLPHGASHRLRFWIRTPYSSISPTSSVDSKPVESYIYQRLWKTDDFKLGGNLNFETLGSKVIIGLRDQSSPQNERGQSSLHPNRQRRSRLLPTINSEASDERVVDR